MGTLEGVFEHVITKGLVEIKDEIKQSRTETANEIKQFRSETATWLRWIVGFGIGTVRYG